MPFGQAPARHAFAGRPIAPPGLGPPPGISPPLGVGPSTGAFPAPGAIPQVALNNFANSQNRLASRFGGGLGAFPQTSVATMGRPTANYMPYGHRFAQGGKVRQAQSLQREGRYGDTLLVHMNPEEVAALAAASPTGSLSINPETGLPEAFLPALLPILGGVAGSALAPASLGMLGSAAFGGLGSMLGSMLGGSSFEQGLQTGLTSFGLGALGGKLFGTKGLIPGLGGQTGTSAGAKAALSKGTGNALSKLGAGFEGKPIPNAPLGTGPSLSARFFNPVTAGVALGGLGAIPPTNLPSRLGRNRRDVPENFPTAARSNVVGAPRNFRHGFRNEFNFLPGLTTNTFQEGGRVGDSIVQEARLALMGIHPNPEMALRRFVERYGQRALNRLKTEVLAETASPGLTQGAGDGMSDDIPAVVDGQEPAALSDGEYVVPADVVSGLGNGSTDAGARVLDEMMDRIRRQRTGRESQPRPISPEGALPL